jgi:hypothetical protein
MIENLLRIAQAELVVLNLAGTNINIEGHKTVIEAQPPSFIPSSATVPGSKTQACRANK